jgi:hypothetical protein
MRRDKHQDGRTSSPVVLPSGDVLNDELAEQSRICASFVTPSIPSTVSAWFRRLHDTDVHLTTHA